MPRASAVLAADAQGEDRRQRDVAQHRHVREEIEELEDHADLRAHAVEVRLVGRHQAAVPRHVPELLAVDLDVAAVDLLERHQDAQDGGLARSRGADQGKLLARRDGEVQVLEDLELAKALRDILDLDNRFRHRRSPSQLEWSRERTSMMVDLNHVNLHNVS